MTSSRIISCILALLLGPATSPAFTQSSGDGLAEQLNIVRQQRRQLEQDISQYETSINLLRSSNSSQETESPAVTALDAQLRRSHRRLLQLVEQEAEILDLLPGRVGERRRPASSESGDLDSAEVARLKKLLSDYSAQASVEDTEASSPETSTVNASLPAATATATATGEYAPGSVILNGAEGVSAIADMGQRLAEDDLQSQRRQLDIIYHIEVRNDGTLLSSRSHNFKALGKSQYISKVSLTGGTAVISVRKDNWVVELTSAPPRDYLLTLSLARGAAPELHVIPVDGLKASQWTELPSWLPDIGVVATTPAS